MIPAGDHGPAQNRFAHRTKAKFSIHAALQRELFLRGKRIRRFRMNALTEIEIRLCKTWDECLQCEQLQVRVWNMPDYRDVVPASFLVTAIKNGGILAGAFQGDEMVGFAFGVLGWHYTGATRRLKHLSHMLGVLPHVREKNVGANLKWKQRAAALEQGLDLMTWTYDPLQSVNARLNLMRLGAIARYYIRDAYGEMTDALNAGIASDRFQVEWLLQNERVTARASGYSPAPNYVNAVDVYEVAWTAQGFPKIAGERDMDAQFARVEIPSDLNALKANDIALAAEWRARTRETFERAFARGLAATDVVREHDASGHTRVFYVLNRVDF